MATNAQADEVPFLAGMEREGQVCETTIEMGKKAFQLDGVLDRLLQKARLILEARQHEEPPKDYAEEDDDIRKLAGIIERLANRPPSNDYHEAPKDSNLKAIVIGCTVTIVSAGVIGAIVLSNNFSAMRAEFTEWKIATEHRLEALERRP